MGNIKKKVEGLKRSSFSAVNVSYYMGLTLFVMSLLQLTITLVYPVGENSNSVVVYSRNVSSVLMFLLLGGYLTCWSVYKEKNHHSRRTMKIIRILTVVVVVGCVLKTLLAVGYTALQFTVNGFSWLYYVGEAIAWACLSVFFFFYLLSKRKRKDDTSAEADKGHHHHHHHHKTEREKRMERIGKDQCE